MWKLTASSFVRVVAAIILMVTLQSGFDATSTIGTSELIQGARRSGTTLLVLAASTVVVAVTLFLSRHTRIGGLAVRVDTGRVARQSTVDIVGLTFTER